MKKLNNLFKKILILLKRIDGKKLVKAKNGEIYPQ